MSYGKWKDRGIGETEILLGENAETCRILDKKAVLLQDRQVAKCPERGPLVPMKATFTFETVWIDCLHLDRAKGGFNYALVCVDHFMRFVQVYAMKNKSGLAATDKIFTAYILKFGFPKCIHHDQGREFNNNLFTRPHKLSGIAPSKTKPYHPMGWIRRL